MNARWAIVAAATYGHNRHVTISVENWKDEEGNEWNWKELWLQLVDEQKNNKIMALK